MPDEEWFTTEFDRYQQQRESLTTIACTAARRIRELLKGTPAEDALVTWRVKKPDSVERKLREKPDRPIQDVAGVRILVPFRSDISWVVNAVTGEFQILPGTIVDKAAMLGPADFGYRSVQFVAQPPRQPVIHDPRSLAALAEKLGMDLMSPFVDTPGIKTDVFEVQVRTILEHGWSEVDHDIRYHPDGPVSATVHRSFASAAALLETADTLFDTIREQTALPGFGTEPVIIEPDDGYVQRVAETFPDSVNLDKRIVSALDVPMGHPERAKRELEAAVYFAGWEDGPTLRQAVRDNADLAFRMAVVCSDVTHSLLVPDATMNRPAVAFPGIGLYWLGIALGGQDRTVNGVSIRNIHGVDGLNEGRLAEYRAVSAYLQAHPAESALSVRDKYRAMAAPAGSRSGQFSGISFG